MYTVPAGTRVDKPWGYECWLAVFPGMYVVKSIHVRAGESLSLQRHGQKHETQFYLRGHATVEHGRDVDAMRVLDLYGTDDMTVENSLTFEPGDWHRITAVTDVEFLEVQTAHPGWERDIERRADKYGREGTTAPVVDLTPGRAATAAQ